MDWNEQVNKATAALKEFAESERVKNLTAKAKQAAIEVAKAAKQGAINAAEAVVKATSDPATLRLHYMNAEINVVSPSDGLQVTRSNAGALVISDGRATGWWSASRPRQGPGHRDRRASSRNSTTPPTTSARKTAPTSSCSRRSSSEPRNARDRGVIAYREVNRRAWIV